MMILLGYHLSAQNLSKSPYSALGVGDMQFGGSAWMHGMGQINQGISFPNAINSQNPASYSAFQLSTWDAAATGSMANISTKAATGSFNTGSMAYMALGMPLSQKLNWGLSFGLMPYSGVGYNVTRQVQTTTFNGTESIEGSGGLSKFYLGSGIRILKGLALGFNASYVYGQIRNTTLLSIPRDSLMYNLVENRDRYMGDFMFEVGLQYTDTFKYKERKYSFGIGTTFGPQTNMSATDNYNVRTLGVGVTAPTNIGKDTIANSDSRSGTVVLPMYLKGGVFFQQVNKWGVGVDVGYNNWANYLGMGVRDSLKNMTSISIGGFYTPDAYAIKGYLKRIEYRAGMRYDNGMLSANGTNVSTLAFSVGAGLPLGKTRSKVNLAAEYMLRGTTEQKLVREEYVRFVIGVSISDKWFHRYRYD
jgi:hypothetical protein